MHIPSVSNHKQLIIHLYPSHMQFMFKLNDIRFTSKMYQNHIFVIPISKHSNPIHTCFIPSISKSHPSHIPFMSHSLPIHVPIEFMSQAYPMGMVQSRLFGFKHQRLFAQSEMLFQDSLESRCHEALQPFSIVSATVVGGAMALQWPEYT